MLRQPFDLTVAKWWFWGGFMADQIGHLPRGPGRIVKATVWSIQGT